MNLKRSVTYLILFISVFYFSNNIEVKAQQYVLESIVASSGTMPSVAYSLRKLTNTYNGPAIRVRRSTDNAEQDIAFVNDELDQTALLAFVGAGNSGFVTTWYDQSGNGRNATNTTAASQPRIVNAGVVDMLNSKPAVRTTLTTQFLDFNYVNSGRLMSTNAVASMNSNTARNGRIVGFATVAGGNDGGSANAFSLGRVNALTSEVRILRTLQLGFANIGGYDVPTVLTTTFDNANTNRLFVNGAIQSTITNAVNANNFGIRVGRLFNSTVANPTLGWVGLVPEIIIFNSTLSNTQQQILERNQASFYNLTPRITYTANNNFTYGYSGAINPTSAANVGTYTITPTLPAGLTLNPTTGRISGTPTDVSSGTYTITNTNSLGSGTFAISLNVNAAPLTVTALTQTKEYGDVLTTTGVSGGTYTVTGFVLTDAAGTLSLTYSGNPSGDLATASVGNYTITPGGLTLSSGELASTKYNIRYVTSTLRVNAAPLTVTALDQTKEYGTNLTNTTGYTQFNSAGFKNGESIESVSVSYASGGTGTSTVGIYNNAIELSNPIGSNFNSSNYAITYEKASLTVNPANLTITATDQAKFYGASLSDGDGYMFFTSSGLKNSESIGSVSVSYIEGSTSTSTVGLYESAIQISNAIGGTFTSTNYTISYNSGDLIINAAPLTVTALSQSKIYGEVLSTIGVIGATYSITGLMNGEEAGTLSLTYSGNPSGDLAIAPIGNYTISPDGLTLSTGILASNNYNITYVSNTLNINPAPLTVTALTQTKMYGDVVSTNGVLSETYTVTGFVNGEAAGTVILTYSGNPSGDLANASVGDYTITPNGLTLTTNELASTNYSITYITSTLNIFAAPLTITATNQTKLYGEILSDGSGYINFTANGLLNGDIVETVNVAYSAGNSPTSIVGTYVDAITISNPIGTAFNSSNYTIAFEKGSITVNPTLLRITAIDQTKIYGLTLTGETGYQNFRTTGLQNGETVGSVTVSYNNGDASTNPVGLYTNAIELSNVIGGTFSNTNYVIEYISGNLIVSAASLTVTALTQTKLYGQVVSTNGVLSETYTVTGFVNGEAAGTLLLTYSGSPSGNLATASVGNYTIFPSNLTLSTGNAASNNYSITYTSGTLIINTAPLTITATDQSKIYGTNLEGADGYTLFTSIGLQNEEKIERITVSYNSGSSASSVVGEYSNAIVLTNPLGSIFNSSNYTINYVHGKLTVNPASLIITAKDQTKVYGVELTDQSNYLEFISQGLQNEETIGSVSVNYLNGASSNSPVSIYSNVIQLSNPVGGTFTSTNYTISYNPGKLTVTSAPLTVTALKQIKVYGDIALTSVTSGGTFTVTGLVNGEAAGTLSLTYSGTPSGNLATASVGDYTITPLNLTLTSGDLASKNYQVTYISATMKIVSAPLTLTGPVLVIKYGDRISDIIKRADYKIGIVGLKNNQLIENVLPKLRLRTNYLSNNPVGSNVSINIDTIESIFYDKNYEIKSITHGRFIIEKTDLTIKVNDLAICEGLHKDSLLKKATYNLIGIKNGELQEQAVQGRLVNFNTNYTSTAKANTNSKLFVYLDLSLVTSNNYNLISDTGFVSIGKEAKVNNITLDANCLNGSNKFNYTPADITDGVIPAGTKYIWAVNSNPLVFGASENDIPANSLGEGQNLTNSSTQVIPFVYNVKPINNGCFGESFKLTVNVKPLPYLNSVADITTCSNQEESIPFSSSTTGNVQYFWTNTNSLIGLDTAGTGRIKFVSKNAFNRTLTSVVTVKPFLNGCFGIERSFNIIVNPIPKMPKVNNAIQSICANEKTLPINFEDSSNSTIRWFASQSNVNMPLSGTGSIPSFVGVNNSSNPINILFSVTPELNGCQGASAILANISINPKIVNKIDKFPSYACPDLPVGPFAVENTTGGNFLNYNYTWEYSKDSIGVYTPINNRQGSSITAPVQDSVRWYRVMTESGGCKSISPSVKVLSRKAPSVKINLNSNSSIVSIGNSVQVFTTGAEQYEWFPKTGVSNAYISSPFLGPLTTTKYTVVGTDNFGCINKDTLSVQVAANYSIEPNKVITPNGDNINDTWEIKNIQFYQDNKITLYNNQGELIRVFDKYTGGWDGSINNRRLPIGNYYYIISLEGGKSSISGFLTVIY